jgi:hypothetical protein
MDRVAPALRGPIGAADRCVGLGHSRSSSGGESRIIRMGYGGDEIYTRMARCSLAEWNELFERTGEALFHRTGVLWMGRAGEPYSESTRSTLERAGVPNRDPVCPGTGPTISADACAGIKLVRHFGAGERRLEGAACDRHCGAGPDLEGRGCKLAFDRHGAPFDPDSGGRKVSAESAVSTGLGVGGNSSRKSSVTTWIWAVQIACSGSSTGW